MYLTHAINEVRKPLEKYGLITAGIGLGVTFVPGLSGLGMLLVIIGVIAGVCGALGVFMNRRNPAS
jgi:hypothetical protein